MRCLFLVLVIALFTGFYLARGSLVVSDLKRDTRSGPTTPVHLPLFDDRASAHTIYRYSGILLWNPPATTRIQITPDDCVVRLVLNGRDAPLNTLAEGRVCDWKNGFLVDLREFLQAGNNSFEIYIENRDGPTALRINAAMDRISRSPPALLLSAGALIFLFVAARKMKLSRDAAVLLAFGLAIRLLYLSDTSPFTRTYDVLEPTGHLDYIRYIRTNFALPPAGAGWQYHQAPLYYLVASAFQSLTGTADSLFALFSLQLLSLVFSIGFLVYALRAYDFVLTGRGSVLLASMLTVFWPSSIIHSVRIGNDGLLYLFSAAALYHSFVWYRREQGRDLLWASAAAALAVLTKSSGALLVVYLCILYAAKLRHSRAKSPAMLRTGAFAFAVLTLAVGAEAGPKIASFARGETVHWLVGNSLQTVNPALFVDNTAQSYLRFDFRTFLAAPYAASWHESGGRQVFWNYFFKSSLFGEFTFDSNVKQFFAKGAGALLLALVAFGAFGARRLRENLREPLPVVLSFSLFLLAALSYRASIPIASAADFRYSLAMLLPGCIIYAQGAGTPRLVAGLSFVLYSAAHMIAS